jgi:hypothetical protein
MAYVRSFTFSGADPRYIWKAISSAVDMALKKVELTLDQIDLIELHGLPCCPGSRKFQRIGNKGGTSIMLRHFKPYKLNKILG